MCVCDARDDTTASGSPLAVRNAHPSAAHATLNSNAQMVGHNCYIFIGAAASSRDLLTVTASDIFTQKKCWQMASSLDEVSFLEQQLGLLNRGAIEEALRMVTMRIQQLKCNPKQFDPKVRLFFFVSRLPTCLLNWPLSLRLHLSETSSRYSSNTRAGYTGRSPMDGILVIKEPARSRACTCSCPTSSPSLQERPIASRSLLHTLGARNGCSSATAMQLLPHHSISRQARARTTAICCSAKVIAV